MNAYTSLAEAYDRLTWDVDYSRILDFLEALLQARGKHPQTVLDLACGTGSLSVLLAKRGYRVIGADMSEDMLAVASEKANELEENVPFFICQRMERLTLPEPVDCVVCCLDSTYCRSRVDRSSATLYYRCQARLLCLSIQIR